MLNIPFCAYLRADFHDLLAVFDGSFLDAFELDVRLDELDGAIGAGGNRLHRRAGEPVDDSAAGDQSQHKGSVQQRQLVDVLVRPCVRAMMMEKIMVVAPTTAVPISTGFAVALKVLPAPSFSSSRCLARSKLHPCQSRFLTSASMFGTCSISDSSYTDCALSVTGP